MREISRKVKLAQVSVIRYLKELEKEELIIREHKGIYPSYKANRDNDWFRFYKKLSIIERIKETGLLDYIDNKCTPNCIILFGSASKGEDIEGSDIDLFIQASETKMDLKKYEKLLNRTIIPYFEENFSRMSEELRNNIINGIILKGYLKVF